MNQEIRAGQCFDKADGSFVHTAIVCHDHGKVTLVVCNIITKSIPHQLLDTVEYTEAEYLAAKGAQ